MPTPAGWQRNCICRGAWRPENPVTCFPLGKGGAAGTKGGSRRDGKKHLCLISPCTILLNWPPMAATPYSAAPDFPLFRGQNRASLCLPTETYPIPDSGLPYIPLLKNFLTLWALYFPVLIFFSFFSSPRPSEFCPVFPI